MGKSNDLIQDDPLTKIHYILILVFAVFAGFIGGAVLNQFHFVINKILLSAGVFLSFLGVYLMVRSTLLKKNGLELVAAGGTPIDRRIYNCGWIALILGVVAQIIGIWR